MKTDNKQDSPDLTQSNIQIFQPPESPVPPIFYRRGKRIPGKRSIVACSPEIVCCKRKIFDVFTFLMLIQYLKSCFLGIESFFVFFIKQRK